MILLSLIGLAVAAWVWTNVHPAAGLVVGFLLVGGAGWSILGRLLSFLRPSARQAFGPEGKQFIAAWEERFGPMRPGRAETQPPPGAFQAWLAEYKKTGVSADRWVASRVGDRFSSGPTNALQAPARLSPLLVSQIERQGDGVLAATNEGLLFRHETTGAVTRFSWQEVQSHEIDARSGALRIKMSWSGDLLTVDVSTDRPLWTALLERHGGNGGPTSA